MVPFPLKSLLAFAALAALARAEPDLAEGTACHSETLCTKSFDPSAGVKFFMYCVSGKCQNIFDETVLAAYAAFIVTAKGTRTEGETCDLGRFGCSRDVAVLLCMAGKCVDFNSDNATDTFYNNIVGHLPLPGPGDGPPKPDVIDGGGGTVTANPAVTPERRFDDPQPLEDPNDIVELPDPDPSGSSGPSPAVILAICFSAVAVVSIVAFAVWDPLHFCASRHVGSDDGENASSPPPPATNFPPPPPLSQIGPDDPAPPLVHVNASPKAGQQQAYYSPHSPQGSPHGSHGRQFNYPQSAQPPPPPPRGPPPPSMHQ